MYSDRLPVIILLLCCWFFSHIGFLGAGVPHYLSEDVAINCGSSSDLPSLDGRKWVGDAASKHLRPRGLNSKLIISTRSIEQYLSVDPIPYVTALVSSYQFSYTFRVNPGQKLIRLHFLPTNYAGFKRSKALFTVKAGAYTLLHNFSASITADALGLQYLAKEFCLDIQKDQLLIITFSPSSDDASYAFVNGIEIISVPDGLYQTKGVDLGPKVVGKNYRLPIDNSMALEMVQRLNVGGSVISSIEDTGMFREWGRDSDVLVQASNVLPVTTTARVKYTGIPSYSAPQRVYQTSWSMLPHNQAGINLNFSWRLPVDVGFRYLIRFHFCELEYEIKSGDKEFSIIINNEMAESSADVMKLSGGIGIAVYADYVVAVEGDRLEGKRDLLILLLPHQNQIDKYDETDEPIDAILKGLEVFKLSNSDNNLAGINPVFHAKTNDDPRPRKPLYAYSRNIVATAAVIVITVLSCAVYQLRVLTEGYAGIHDSSTSSHHLPSALFEGCPRFSLSEIQTATNNFDGASVIGCGGFGKVYKGHLNFLASAVAIKRLNSKSQQGAAEFWTEIQMLSQLRHPHLVTLLGYCVEAPEMILVYELMQHGSLDYHLYRKLGSNNRNVGFLSWEQRLNMCIGAARGLDYLHTGIRPGLIHRDVKSSNILLDQDWVAKISDFGLCQIGTTSCSHTHVSTDVKGTIGYLDPEYFMTRKLTKKSDVYAFGVLLFEVLCGRPAVVATVDERQRSLVMWVQLCIKEGTLNEIIDPCIRRQITYTSLQDFLHVAEQCIRRHPNGRPTMADVVTRLERALESSTEQQVTIVAKTCNPVAKSPSHGRQHGSSWFKRSCVVLSFQ